MNLIKKIVSGWNKLSLVLRIVLGLVVGSILGLLLNAENYPGAQFIGIFGELYIGLLKSVAPVLVFVLVINALSQGGEKRQTKGTVGKIVVLYLISSFVAAAIAVTASFLFRVPIPGLQPVENGGSAETNLWLSIAGVLKNVVSNPIGGIVNGNYLPILFWACVFGVFFRKSSDGTKKILGDLAQVVSSAVQLVISFAPIGVLGLIFSAISTSGAAIFIEYGKLIIILVVTMLFVTLVSNPIIVAFCIRANPYPLLFKCLKDSGINAFFTRSSAANIPVNLRLCRELGLNEKDYSITIPLGSTINMAGAAVVITVMTLATVWALEIPVDFAQAIFLCFVGTIAACGTAGTAGGSLMLLPLSCSMFGIPTDIAWASVAVGMQIGVIQDSCETAINSSSDVLFTASVGFRETGRKKI